MLLIKSIYSEFRLIINFIKATFKFCGKIKKDLSFLKIKNVNKQTKKIQNIYIYLNDWLSSPSIFYNVYLGLLLNKNKNIKVIFLFDRTNFYKNIIKSHINNLCIKIIINEISKNFKINTLDLNKFNKYNSKKFDNIIKKNIYINKVRYSTNANPKNYNRFYQYHKRKEYLKIIGNFLQILKLKNTNDLFIFPGGYLNSTYTLTEILKVYKNNFYTYDAGFYKNIPNMHFCKNGIAGKVEESLNAYKKLCNIKFFTEAKKNKIKKIVFKDLNLNIKNSRKNFLRNQFNFKINNKFILITLGTGWDANSIDSIYFFKNYSDFLEKTIEFLSKNFKSHQIIIKDHPSRVKSLNKNDSLNLSLKKILNKKNITYFGPEEENTYDLIKKSSLLISVASKTISEAILLKKRAISAGKDQYFFFNIHKKFNSRSDFFKFIKNSIRKKNKINQKIYDKIIIQYFLNNISKYIFAKFIPLNFNWLNISCKKIYSSYEFQLIQEMLINKNTFLFEKVKKDNNFKYIKKYFKV